MCWNRTELAQERQERSGVFQRPDLEGTAPYGFFKKRRIIGSGMEHITGGVFIGGSIREAIVVTDHRNILIDFYCVMLRRWQKRRDPDDWRCGILTHVTKEVRKAMPGRDVDRVLYEYDAMEPDQKIGLTCFLREGVGVCRHMALLAGYCLERLKEESPNQRLRGHQGDEGAKLELEQIVGAVTNEEDEILLLTTREVSDA